MIRFVREGNWPKGVESQVHFRELKDWLSIASEEYGAVLLEEAGEIPRDAVLMALSRLRHPAAKKYALVAASNPWPGWFEDWFVRKQVDEVVLAQAGGQIHFIPAKISDNPYLPTNYEALLRALYPEDWVARLVDGSFETFEGQVYRELGPHMLWDKAVPPLERLVGGLDFGGANDRAHKTAGVVAGLDYERNLIRVAHFEHSGPDVYELLTEWMRHCEMLLAEGDRASRRINWRADKTQMWGIEQAKSAGFIVNPSHGGSDSIWLGIVQQRKRMKDGTSYYVPELLERPRIGGRLLNGDSWYESMRRYRWDTQPNDSRRVPGTPIKRDDDTADADRYMSEEADGFPVFPYRLPAQDMGGRILRRTAV